MMKLFKTSNTKNITDDIVTPTPLIENGYLYVPQGPGLGVTLNRDGLEKYLEGDPIEIGNCND